MDGLTGGEARRRLVQYGPNVLPEKRRFSAATILIHQFASPLIFVLLGALVITLILGDGVDAVVIGVAVAINTILGFIQEYKAQNAMAALKKILTPQAKVVRSGEIVTIPAAGLVPGDVVILSAGDRVPADGKVFEAVSLFINESMITGESMPVEKISNLKSQISNVLYMGTIVASGRGKMEVTATGRRTKIGMMAISIEETEKGATPLQRELSRLAWSLTRIVLVMSVFLFLLGLYYGEELMAMLTTVVAIAVSAIPEGLVVSLTVILALGMQRIMRREALVRRMVAAETLGSVSTICVDKTGTITEGQMTVVKSDFTDKPSAIRAVVLANNLEDPLEIALWDWARAQDHIDPQEIVDRAKRIGEVPFDSMKKYMSVTTQDGMWVKGAPEAVLAKSDLPEIQRKEWMRKVALWGSEGLRVIALGYKPSQRNPTPPPIKVRGGEEGLFLGIIGISDPVREGVAEAVAHVQKAGVAVTMVTGDYRATAQAVLEAIGVPIRVPDREIMEGSEVSAIAEGELARRIKEIRLFCRVSPDQKHKIVSSLQAVGEVVAMAGDGVNDALALKTSDIGIVVEGASDVAKETADLVLLDSNFKTIVAAIEEGRAIFDNVRKVTFYLLSDAFVEIALIAAAILLGLPLPLTAIQILWINLVDDGFPTLALTVDPRSHGLMKQTPRPKTAAIVDRGMAVMIGIISASVAGCAMILFLWAGGGEDLTVSRTMVFSLVAVSTLVYVFSCRVMDRPLRLSSIAHNRWLVAAVVVGALLQLFAVYHPWGNHAFGTVPVRWEAWGVIIGASTLIVGMIEVTKRIRPIRPVTQSDQ